MANTRRSTGYAVLTSIASMFTTVDPVADAPALEAELARLVRLRCLGGPRGRLARRPPRLTVRAATREKHLHGFAHYDRHEIAVIVYAGTDMARARATLIHELVHMSGLHAHDAAFRVALVAAVREAWDVDVSAHEYGPYKVLDSAIEDALRWRPFWVWVHWARAAVMSMWTSTSPARATS